LSSAGIVAPKVEPGEHNGQHGAAADKKFLFAGPDSRPKVFEQVEIDSGYKWFVFNDFSRHSHPQQARHAPEYNGYSRWEEMFVSMGSFCNLLRPSRVLSLRTLPWR
jgi:hypothetical protein